MYTEPLDVPHWAISIVSSYRKELTIPPHITDREIYAALVSYQGSDLAGEMDAVRALITSHQHKGTPEEELSLKDMPLQLLAQILDLQDIVELTAYVCTRLSLSQFPGEVLVGRGINDLVHEHILSHLNKDKEPTQ